MADDVMQEEKTTDDVPSPLKELRNRFDRLTGWPPFAGVTAGGLVAFGGTLLGFTIYLFPEVIVLTVWRRVLLLLTLLVGPVVIYAVVWSLRFVYRMFQRARLFRTLYDVATNQIENLSAENNRTANIVRVLQLELTTGRFKIQNCSVAVGDPGPIIVRLNKKQGAKLSAGDRLRVVNSNNGRGFAECVVTDVDADCYRCVAAHDVDPVLEGYIRKADRPVDLEPAYVAIRLTAEEGESDD